MALQFTVSAPGKVILNGEHSVVYNKPALAGVIQLRNSVQLTESDVDSIRINFDLFSNVPITYELSALNILLKKLSSMFSSTDIRTELVSHHDKYLKIVETFVQENTQLENVNENQKHAIFKALTAIVYLFSALEMSGAKSAANAFAIDSIPKLHKGLTLDFKSEIPIGAGLGSSASYAVCVAATFYVYSILHSRPEFLENGTETKSKDFYNTISAWAFLSERIMHGTPSGLDNTVCTYGNVVKFTKSPPKFDNVVPKTKIHMMLVNTGVSRNTLEAVRNVRTLRETHTKSIDHIMDAMGSIVGDVVEILEDEDSANEQNNFEKLKRLFVINNNLLRALGVSHPVLEEIFGISERYGFASKLTGAGVGGFAIILLPPNYSNDEAFRKLSSDLSHFQTNVTSIGGPGLQIIY